MPAWSRFLDLVVGLWIPSARGLIVASAFGLAAYLLVRPVWAGADYPGEHGASWYDALRDSSLWMAWPRLLSNTLVLSAVASAVSLVVAVPSSFLLFRTNLPGRRMLVSLLLLPACTPVFANASAVLALIGVRPWYQSAMMAGLIHGWIGIPLAILLIGWGYRSIDRNLEEAAVLDMSWVRVGLIFDLPLLLWSLLSVVALQTWIASTDITVSDLLAVRTFAEEVYATFQLSRSAHAQTMVVIPYVVFLGGLVLVIAWAARGVDLRFRQLDYHPVRQFDLGKWCWPCCAGVTAILGALILVPTIALLGHVESLEEFARFAMRLREEVWDSALMAFATGFVLLLLALGATEIAVAANRRARWFRRAMVLLLALPTPCLAIALIEILNRPGPLGWIYDSMPVLVIGQTLRWLPLVILLAAPGFGTISRDVRDAARIDGCNTSLLHRHVYWPLSWQFLSIAGLAGVIMALGELTACALLNPPGVLPLSVRFFTLVHYGLRGEAAATCLLVVLLMMVPWTLLVQLLQRSETR